jgi:two-component system nitrate/nitrite sensor histidine kinase NarX
MAEMIKDPVGRRARLEAVVIFLAALVIETSLVVGLARRAPDGFQSAGILVLAGGIALGWHTLAARRKSLELRLDGSESSMRLMRKELDTVLAINIHLADARDEQDLMRSVISAFSELTGASGGSYVPLDELGQPLAIVRLGQVPEDELRAWAERLSSIEIHDACLNCVVRKAEHSIDCPVEASEIFGDVDTFCLPVRRGDRMLGMLNLFLLPGTLIPDELAHFFEGLLNEIALGVETLRLRAQELATLQQIQLVRSPREDTETLLKNLLGNARQALEADFGMIFLAAGDKQPQQIIVGTEDAAIPLDSAEIHRLIKDSLRSGENVSMVGGPGGPRLPAGVGAVLVAPLQVNHEPALGAIVLANSEPHPFFPRQVNVLKTVALEVALLVERERFILDLEYRSIIDERSRLAREIHDGLAQTLAFLKMQASQMQNAMARGDEEKVRELMTTSYQALSEAYLDTRQAIDNLRIAPREGLADWLGQVIRNFEDASGIKAELSMLSPDIALPDEIQAQLIRVIQEALSNIRKHARAKNVRVTVMKYTDDLIVEIQDDGQGFSSEDVPHISQYGLRGMRERAEMIGADFQIISSPEQGTTVRLRLPYHMEETPV